MFDEQFARLPSQAPRSADDLPGLKFGRSVPRSTWLVPLILLPVMALPLLVIVSVDPALRLSFGKSERAEGRVLSVTNSAACRGQSGERVVYDFPLSGVGRVRGAANLCGASPYRGVREGDPVPVRFLTSDPAVNTLPGTAQNAPPLGIFAIFPAIIGVILLASLAPHAGALRRARRCYERGRLATATVVYVRRRAGANLSGTRLVPASEVYLQYQPLGGEPQEAVAVCANDWLIGLLQPGARVHIAYLDEDPARVALLEAWLR